MLHPITKRLVMRSALLWVSLLSVPAVYAQRPVAVRYEKDNSGTYTFFAHNGDYCPYTVRVLFQTLTNLRADRSLPYVGECQPGQTVLFRLQRIQPNQPSNFNYSTRYYKGCMQPKVDTTVVYLLPVAPGKPTQVRELEYIGRQLGGETEPRNWYALQFMMNAGDTVFAVRRGIVTQVEDDVQVSGPAINYYRNENRVQVYHADCSFATYTVFKQKSIFVRPGQTINPGDPIGIVGGDAYSSGPQVRLFVHYNENQSIMDVGQPASQNAYWAYVRPKFWTNQGRATHLVKNRIYIADHDETVVTQEMSKREIKNRKKTKSTGQ